MDMFEDIKTGYDRARAGLAAESQFARIVLDRMSGRSKHLLICSKEGVGVLFSVDETVAAKSGSTYLSIKEPTAVKASGGGAVPILPAAGWHDDISLARGWHQKAEDRAIWILKLLPNEAPAEVVATAYAALVHTAAKLYGSKVVDDVPVHTRPLLDDRRLLLAWSEDDDKLMRARWPSWLTSPTFATTRQSQLAALRPDLTNVIAAVR
jgi:hypothetical protein